MEGESCGKWVERSWREIEGYGRERQKMIGRSIMEGERNGRRGQKNGRSRKRSGVGGSDRHLRV